MRIDKLRPETGMTVWIDCPDERCGNRGPVDGTPVTVVQAIHREVIVVDREGRSFTLHASHIDAGYAFEMPSGWCHESESQVLEWIERFLPSLHTPPNAFTKTKCRESLIRVFGKILRRNARAPAVGGCLG